MNIFLLKLLPKKILTAVLGVFADYPFPRALLHNFLRYYSTFYNVNLNESEKEVHEFRTFNQFFTRKLKEEARQIDIEKSSIVSPVDGKISEFGRIEENSLIQTKGVHYQLDDLVGKYSGLFSNGSYLTIYLSPGDYHRIHSPLDAKVKEFSFFSGDLWPVNDLAVKNIGGLFTLNERIVTLMHGEIDFAIVKVAATVVGKIKTKFYRKNLDRSEDKISFPVVPPRFFKKGQELALFELGSTVILLFQEDKIKILDTIQKNQKILLGQKIASIA